MTVDIICADAREGLARFPDGHFHCCVTSPPYWSLRDYGLEPTVWGDDGFLEDCEHEWGEVIERRLVQGATNPTDSGTLTGGRDKYSPTDARSESAFCRRCNAWRGTLGLEPTVELFVGHLVSVMREVRRVLRDDGTLWLNLGDSYAGGPTAPHKTERSAREMQNNSGWTTREQGTMASLAPGLKPKDLVGVPWRVAFALQADGWWLRSDIVWSKPNPMPESVTDRPTRSHEYLFLLTKRGRYYYDQEAIREPSIHAGRVVSYDGSQKNTDHENRTYPGADGSRDIEVAAGRNRRSVWEIATQPFGLEMCGSCKAIYEPAQYRRLRGGSNPRCNHEVVEGESCGGTQWLAQDGGAVCIACETFYTAKQLTTLPRAAKCRSCGSEEWLSHFAVFPEKLVEPCILTTSEWGCCPECGAPWERVVEKGTEPHPNRWSKQADAKQFSQGDGDYGEGGSLGVAHTSTTTGWRPTCKHGAEPVPCRVLDPFAGSGTVGVVAERLGRHSVLIDAKDEYCEMARHRTAQRGLMVSGECE